MHASVCPFAVTRACCDADAEVLEPMRIIEICFGNVLTASLLFGQLFWSLETPGLLCSAALSVCCVVYTANAFREPVCCHALSA